MKMKTVMSAVLAVALLVLSGCKSNNVPLPMQKAVYVSAISTGVSFGVERYPQAVPYLRVAQPIICAAGAGTNVSPLEIVAALTNSPAANAIATQEGKAIMNGVIAIYGGVFESYGADWVNQQETLRNYLQWSCEAIALGLPPIAGREGIAGTFKAKALAPHIR